MHIIYGPCPSCHKVGRHQQASAIVVNANETSTLYRCQYCKKSWNYKGEVNGGRLVGTGTPAKEQPTLLDERWYLDQGWIATLQWEHDNWNLLRRIER